MYSALRFRPLLRYGSQEDIRIAKRNRALRNHIGLRPRSCPEGIHCHAWGGVARVGPHGVHMRDVGHRRDIVTDELSAKAMSGRAVWIGCCLADLQGKAPGGTSVGRQG